MKINPTFITILVVLYNIQMSLVSQPLNQFSNQEIELNNENSRHEISNDSTWIHYDDVENYDSWGFLTNGELYDVIAKWDPEDLVEYEDWAVTKVKFIVTNELPIIKVKIWEGENGIEIFSQDVVQNVNEWTEVTLDEPFDFDHTKILMVGYEVDMTMTELGGFVTATDDGPPEDGYGNLVRLNGQWLSEYNNHNLRVLLELNFVADFSAEKTNICDGDDVQFTNLSTGAETYLWTFEGGNPSSSALENPTVNYSIPGNYDVTLEITKDGNTISEHKPNYINVNEVPSPIEGDQLVCDWTDSDYSVILSEGSNYTWEIINGEIVSGQGTNMITVGWYGEGIGDILCIEQTIYGCSGSSDPFEVVIDNCTGVYDQKGDFMIGITSNPVTGNYMMVSKVVDEDVTIQILDINGIIVHQQVLDSQSNKVETNRLNSGMYFLKSVYGNGYVSVQKFIKN